MTSKHTSIVLSLGASLLVLTSAASGASAQTYEPAYEQPYASGSSGLYGGIGLSATRIMRQDGGSELLENGGGLTLYGGLRINQSLSIELGWMGSLHNPVAVDTNWGPDTDYLVLNGFTADAKLHLNVSNPRLEPFLQAGLGAYLLDSEYFGTQSAGSGFQVGGGFNYQVGPRMDLGLRGLYRGMSMGPPSSGYTDTFVSALTIEGNLTFYL